MVKEVRDFWVLETFIDRLCKKKNIAKLLNDTTKKDQPFNWTMDCQQAFEELKRHFTEEPVLIMPDQTKPFQIECDASKYASGAVLTQVDGNGNQHPCTFISKNFQTPKETMRYSTGNCWPSYEHSNSGDIIFKGCLILP